MRLPMSSWPSAIILYPSHEIDRGTWFSSKNCATLISWQRFARATSAMSAGRLVLTAFCDMSSASGSQSGGGTMRMTVGLLLIALTLSTNLLRAALN